MLWCGGARLRAEPRGAVRFRSPPEGQPAAMDTKENVEENVGERAGGAFEEAPVTQGDEHHVLLSADTNGDGKPDVWVTDTTGDGTADLYQFDTTGDGKVDVTVVEGAEEPGTDRLVVEGDGGHPQEV